MYNLIDPNRSSLFLSFGLVARGPGRCNVNNGGCWQESRNGLSMSACVVSYLNIFLLFFPH